MNPGRLILPALRWRAATGFSHEAAAIDAALAAGVGGFIVFGLRGAAAADVTTLTAELGLRAGRPLIIASDLERGAGQQVQGLTEFPPPLALASLGDPAVVRWAAAVTAREARSVGINWVLAPVADLDVLPENPIIQTRAFGPGAAEVAKAVAEWVAGCQDAGAPACAKHYPGHGRTKTDSHEGLPIVSADRAALEHEDAAPFEAAIAAGVAAIMTAHVAYPALDPTGRPATFSSAILNHLRRDLGFDGVVVTDALIMEGALAGHGEGEAAVQALAAGCDVLLYPNDVQAVKAALMRALAAGELGEVRAAEAEARASRLLARATLPVQEVAPGPFRTTAELADALLARGLIRGAAPRLEEILQLVVVDDDIGGPYQPIASDYVARTLAAGGASGGTGGSRVVLAFAEPRAWKGRAGFGSKSRAALQATVPGAALVVLFGHPRLLAEIPGDAPVLLAWNRQQLMQEAVGRWLLGRRGS